MKQMESEIDQHETWSNGGCYSVKITDLNGDEIDYCGGFVGHEAVDKYIDDFVGTCRPPPNRCTPCG